MRSLLILSLGFSLALASYGKPKVLTPKATHPLVIKHPPHASIRRKPHQSVVHKAPHPALAYTPKKAKHFKIAKP
ncbi:MAG TPA: hypothetical protein VMB25_05400 [Bryobacteraceae bacterium]|nr:hypothetical protein [Bryobacteraceae bacterium]